MNKLFHRIISFAIALLVLFTAFPQGMLSYANDYSGESQGGKSERGVLGSEITVWDGSAATGFESGTGTENDPFVIKTAEQLAFLSQSVNAGVNYEGQYIKLANDIYLNDTTGWEDWENDPPANEWTGIGCYIDGNNDTPFSGFFDGDGHKIYGIYSKDPNGQGHALFRYVAGGHISNVSIEESFIYGEDAAGICNWLSEGSMTACRFSGIVFGRFVTAGVCGANGGTIDGCVNDGYIGGIDDQNQDVAGICGYNTGTITNCSNTGTVFVTNYVASYIGGVCGENLGTIENCYSSGDVSGYYDVGGVCGQNLEGGVVTNCCNTGAVSGSGSVGGICGYNYNATVCNCYNTGEIRAENNYAVKAGGVCGDNSGTLSDCYNTGNIIADNRAGGVCGCNYGTTFNCYSTGTVKGSYSVGGVCGAHEYGSIENCYYLTGCITSGGWNVVQYGIGTDFQGGSRHDVTGCTTGLSSEEMRVSSSFTGFDFDSVWTTGAFSGYDKPTLSWQTVMDYSNSGTGEENEQTVINIWDGSVADGYESGSGTEKDPWIITTAEQLAYLASQINSGAYRYPGYKEDHYFRLDRDIYLNDVAGWENWGDEPPANEWTPIGSLAYNAWAFDEYFDGNGHVIYGMYINQPDSSYLGLFGGICYGYIENLGLEASYVHGKYFVGGICGCSKESNSISCCYNAGNVTGDSHVGGIGGCFTDGRTIVLSCFNVGTVSGQKCVGGIIGTFAEGFCYYSYNAGTVSGANRVGGVCGNNAGRIITCHNAGTVTGSGEYVGGVCGISTDMTKVSSCYYLAGCATDGNGTSQNGIGSETQGQKTEDISEKTTGLDAAKMTLEPSFNGFDFDELWDIGAVNGCDYPTLRWQQYIDGRSGEHTHNSNIPSKEGVWTGNVSDSFNSGSGTEADPYIIATPEQLAYFAASVNAGNSYNGKYIKFVDDIFLNDTSNWENWEIDPPANEWIPIGKTESPFSGTFDGDGHVIYGIYIDQPSKDDQGLFGYANGKTIRRLGVEQSFVKGNERVGGVCGYSNRCQIVECYAACNISGNYDIGGICGYNYGYVRNCYSTGDIKGDSTAGGICGYSRGTIGECYSNCKISGAGKIGGVCGIVNYVANACYYDKDGASYGSFDDWSLIVADSDEGLKGLNESQLRNAASFNGFDFDNVWNIGVVEGYDYPTLKWQTDMCSQMSDSDDHVHKFVLKKTEDAYLATPASCTVGELYYYSCECGEQGRYTFQNETLMPHNFTAQVIAAKYLCTSATAEAAETYYYSCVNCGAIGNETFEYGGLYGEPVVWNGTVASCFYSGSGSSKDPYIIKTPEQLAFLAQMINSGLYYSELCFKLANDIYLNDTTGWENWETNPPANEWIPIGSMSSHFECYFDGDGHVVYGLYINQASNNYQGLFGFIESPGAYYSGHIRKVGIAQSFIKGKQYVGGICGYSYLGQIDECYVNANVSGDYGVGGICGAASYYSGISNSYSSGSVAGKQCVGGICGLTDEERVYFENCYSACTVSGKYKSNVGGICGFSENDYYVCCYYGSGGATCGGFDSNGKILDADGTVRGLDETQLRDAASFSGFDFNQIWNIGVIDGYDYPTLRWQEPRPVQDAVPGDLDGDGEVTDADAIYLLYYTLFGDEDYPINQQCDYDGDGYITDADAIYLLYYTLFGEEDYPIAS